MNSIEIDGSLAPMFAKAIANASTIEPIMIRSDTGTLFLGKEDDVIRYQYVPDNQNDAPINYVGRANKQLNANIEEALNNLMCQGCTIKHTTFL
jgi:hypothetical protein